MLRDAVDITLRKSGFILWVMKSHLKGSLLRPSVFCSTLVSIHDVLKIAQAASLWGPGDLRHSFEYIIK